LSNVILNCTVYITITSYGSHNTVMCSVIHIWMTDVCFIHCFLLWLVALLLLLLHVQLRSNEVNCRLLLLFSVLILPMYVASYHHCELLLCVLYG